MACHYKPYFLHHSIKNIDSNNTQNKSALLIVDVQKAFLPGGSLSILPKENISNTRNKSIMMINNINKLIDSNKFDYHIYSQDSHPDNHISFASSSTYKSGKPFQVTDVNLNNNITQIVLHPDHCRIDGRDSAPQNLTDNSSTNTTGSGIEFADELLVPNTFRDPNAVPDLLSEKSFVLNKGENINSNPFSAFKDYMGQDTGLHNTLINKGVKNIYVCGLARDFCVWWTVADASSYVDIAQQSVFNTSLIWDASLPVYSPVYGTELLLPDYTPEEKSNSPHRLALHNFLNMKQNTLQNLVKDYNSNDPRSNRWVQCFLTPYKINAVRTSDLMSPIISNIKSSIIDTIKNNTNNANKKSI
jgi:nicotinamidase/pyrazinamidase